MWDFEDESATTVSELTVAEFEALCESVSAQRVKCDEAAAAKKAEDDKLNDLERKMMETLKAMGRDNYKSKVGTFSISHRLSVQTPKSPEDKAAFFKYLQDRGVYDSMITVNSQTLNAFYKAEFEAAKEAGEGLDFKVPGIGEPKVNEILSFRKAKV